MPWARRWLRLQDWIGPAGAINSRTPTSLRTIHAVPEANTRERIIEAMQSLPEDEPFDDAIERLVFLARLEEGLTQLDKGAGIPHDEVKRRLNL